MNTRRARLLRLILLLLAAGAGHTAWSGEITDGLLDPSFSDDGKLDIGIRPDAYDRVDAIAVAPDGKLYLMAHLFCPLTR